MIETTSPGAVRLAHLTRRELALIDVRGEAPYALGHPLFASSLPLDQIEERICTMVPRRDAPIVVYDDGEGYAQTAILRLRELGYRQVSALAGGLLGWRSAGFELFRDVNSASKAFGELVEARRHTPSIPATDAKAMLETEPNLVVLDARRFDEFNTMSIPRGISVPGAELVLRAGTIAPDPATTIIVNCAGRTRSIIGAQSLINAGVPNPVMALQNGTIGWSLAGYQLEHGQTMRFPAVGEDQRAEAGRLSRSVAYCAGVKHILPRELDDLAADPCRTLYRFDVRSPDEYRAGHIAGFANVPGGQLVQETDAVAAVRGAQIVLADDIGPRADMSASWLAQMGWEVYVLDGGFGGDLVRGPAPDTRPAAPDCPMVGAADVAGRIIDVATSSDYGAGHIPGAMLVARGKLAKLGQALRQADVTVTSRDGYRARFAVAELIALGVSARALAGGTDAWRSQGLPIERGDGERLGEPDDVYRRPYEGTDNPASAMQAYLDWEAGLVAQLERDGSHGFFVI